MAACHTLASVRDRSREPQLAKGMDFNLFATGGDYNY